MRSLQILFLDLVYILIVHEVDIEFDRMAKWNAFAGFLQFVSTLFCF